MIVPGKTGMMLLAALSLAGCATAGGGTAGDPPESREVEPQADPEPPDLSLEERWEEPFAVLSSGRPATRREGESERAAADEGDAPAPASTTAAPSSTTSEPGDAADTLRTHRVEWGETWFGIARRYGVSRADLAAANPAVDPEQLRAGEVLVIPVSGTEVDGGVLTHTVVAGDSLWGIARRYDVEMDAIRQANGLDGDRVRIGQTLIIPVP